MDEKYMMLILDRCEHKFIIIHNLPDDIVEDYEKQEDFLDNNGYDLKNISWICSEEKSGQNYLDNLLIDLDYNSINKYSN